MIFERKDTYYIPALRETVEAGEYAGRKDVEIAALKKQAGKNNNAFIMGMSQLDGEVPSGLFDGYLEKKAKDAGLRRSSVWEATKGFGEGVGRSPGSTLGYFASNTLPLIAKASTTAYALSGAAGSPENADKWLREMNKGIDAYEKELRYITGIEDASGLQDIVGNAIGSVWGSVAIGGTVGGGAVAPMFGLSAGQDTYTKQRDAGTGMGESALRAAWHGVGEWQLERLQFNRIFGALSKNSKPIAIIKDLLENAVQEGLQQANEIGANWNIDERSLNLRGLTSVLQEIGVSMVGGAIASLSGSVGGNILNKKTINEVGDLMKKTGHSDEEIKKVKENLNKIADTDELEQAARQVANDELTTAALTYKEQAQATSEALVTELEDTIARNELVDVGGELNGGKPKDMKPMYQLGDLQVDTEKNPHLGMVLYQAEQEGKPIETLGQVVEWTKNKIGSDEYQKLNKGVSAVYNLTYDQLKGIGQDERLADSNARIRSAMAFTLAKNFGLAVEKANEMLGKIQKAEFGSWSIETPKMAAQVQGDTKAKVTEKLNQTKGNLEFNMTSLKDKTSVDYLKEVALKNGMKEKDYNSLIDRVFDVADYVNSQLKDVPGWQEWNGRQIKSFVDSAGIPLPIRSIFVKNGDYDFNIDLGTLCVKREFADKVIKYLIDKGYGQQIGLVKLEQIKSLLRKYEIAVACDVCFIEGKRLNARTLSNGLAYEWQSVREALGIKDNLSVGTPREYTKQQLKMLDEMTDRRYVKDNGTIMSEEEYDSLSKEEKKKVSENNKRVFEVAFDKYMPIERRRVKLGKVAYDRGITSDKMYSIAKLFRQNSELSGELDPDILMNSEQTTALAEKYFDTELPSFLGSYAGAGTPKPLYGFNPYTELSWRDKYDRNADKLNEMLYSIGGVRGQSFSDYNEMLFVDYLQKYLAETVRALPAHEYTKQASLVKTFGDTGVMFNMSLVPKIEKGIDVKHYGLRKATEQEIKNGKSKEGFILREDVDGVWTYSFHTDSFPVDEAFKLRETFDKTSGIIVVGVSDMQIEMMLDDPMIDMVIPFHASGMPAHTKLVSGLVDVDYSKTQTTKGLKTGQADFSYNTELQKIKDPRKTAKAYLDWCKEKGLTQKFPQFSDNKNYYKLLEDFRGYDKNGKPIIQGAVDITKADWNRIKQEGVSSVKERAKTLKESGDVVFSQEFQKELDEIFKYQQVDTETQELFKDRLGKVLGKDNVFFLTQDKFLESLHENGGEVFRNNTDGMVYGYAKGNKVYINESSFNAHTPAHEFAHIWGKVVQQYNPKLWENGVKLLEQTNMWKDVQKDEMYWQIQNDRDAVAREVLARLTGQESEAMIKKMLDYHEKGHAVRASLVSRIMNFIKEMYNTVLDAFNLKSNVKFTVDDFTRMPLVDLLDESRHKAFKKALKNADLDGHSEFNKALFQSGYVSMRNPLVGTQLDADAHYGEGEHGNMAHGWGNYLLLDRLTNLDRYYNKFNKVKVKLNPKEYEVEMPHIIEDFVSSVEYEFVGNKNPMGSEKANIKWAVDNVIRRKEEYLNSLKKEYEEKENALNKKGFITDEAIRDDLIWETNHLAEKISSEEIRLKYYKKIDINSIDLTGGTAEQHEFDIPDREYLLDEQMRLKDQSYQVKSSVKELLNKIFHIKAGNDYTEQQIQDHVDRHYANLLKQTGYGVRSFFYHLIENQIEENRNGRKSSELEAEKQRTVSKLFESVGIKGYAYEGGIDGAGVVIFNKEDTKHIRRLLQERQGKPLGAYYNNTIYLFENANESTFVHEMGHAYMDVLEKLSQEGNKKAQQELDIIRNWLGKKKGKEFTQADWERFARGFEMYIREGKAPNEYLGGEDGVFARFRNWLLGIYNGIKSLTVKNEKGKEEPVRINNQIRQFYSEMLGGADIDKVFETAQKNEQAMSVVENKLKELAELQQRLAQERAKLVREMANDVKPETTWGNVKDWGNNLWKSIKELPKELLKASASRLEKIDPRLGLLVQRVEQSQGLRLKKWADQLKPFYEAFNKLSADDKAKVQFYLLNQQWGEVADMIGEESTNAVHDVLESIYQELIDSGVEVGYRDDYFPRAVLDYDGLLQEMGLTYPSLRKEMETAIGKNATPQEQAEWLDKHILGFKGNVSLNKNRNTKERKLDLITPRMAKYYKPSMDTLVDYLNSMAKLLSMREAFGRDIQAKENLDVGKIIENLFGINKLTKKETDEITQVLNALFMPSGIGNKFIQAMRQYGYATKLSYSTTIRQFADIGMMMKVNGVLNTLDALFHPDKRLSLETLGIDPLGEEFRTSGKDISGRIANISTKYKGINWADAIMKNTFIRGNYKSLQKLAKDSDKFHEKYDRLFGDETETIRKDLLADKISEPVKTLLFHEISKIQPISRSAMPTAYLNHPDGRVFYMFKTFSLHRAEYMVSELAEDFRRGDYKKAGKDIMADVAVIGWEGLVELLIAFLKYGWAALAGEQVLETFAGSGLGVFGLNKHQALQLARGQVGDFLQNMLAFGSPIDDIAYLIRNYDKDDKLLRAFLPDMIIEPLIAGPKELK